MGYAIVSDKNIENLEIGDKVLLFGKIGTVVVVSGAYGIYFKDGVPWELIIRQDVYDRAIAGSGRDRLTLAHELGHLLFHEKQNISYARVGDNTGIVVFRDPEWQADAFGGEVLMLKEVIKGHNVKEVMNLCKVSEKAALCQLSK